MASKMCASSADLDAYLAHNSYLGSASQATCIDFDCCRQFRDKVQATTAATEPHFYRWFMHMSALIGSGQQEACAPAGEVPQELQAGTVAKTGAARKVAARSDLATASAAGASTSAYKYICVLDFEKTCERDVQLDPQEIIEFPSVLLDVEKNGAVVAEFESFVKPTVHPTLTAFCTELTGITQENVDGAATLPTVLKQHYAWLTESIGADDSTCIFLSCGDMDLKRSLPEDPNIDYTDDKLVPAVYKRWLNIKKEFGLFYKQWYPKKGKQPRNMTEMLEKLELELEGKHHSGIDDCRNIGNVVRRMLDDGWRPVVGSATKKAE